MGNSTAARENRSPYRLAAFDMDGTLLLEDKTISPRVRYWIAEAVRSGVMVMFSTGRGRDSAAPYAEELKLEAPMVTVNGSEVWRTPAELLKRTLMPLEWIRTLRGMAQEFDVWYWAYATDSVYNRENWPGSSEREVGMDWLKFGFYTENLSKLAAIRHRVEEWGVFETTNSHPFNLELNPRGISKASGLQEVCKLVGIRMEQVIAAGDSLNDAAMIEAAGLGIAMGNAQEEVKLLADAVVDSNEEDGAAEVIWRHIFGLSSLAEADAEQRRHHSGEKDEWLSAGDSAGAATSPSVQHEQDLGRSAMKEDAGE